MAPTKAPRFGTAAERKSKSPNDTNQKGQARHTPRTFPRLAELARAGFDIITHKTFAFFISSRSFNASVAALFVCSVEEYLIYNVV